MLEEVHEAFYRPGERNWRNEELHEKAKLKTLEEMQEQRQWSYLGHVLRRQEGNPHRELMKTFEKVKKRRTTKKQFVRRSERENQKERVESRRISASCRKPPGVENENSPSQKK